MSKIRKKVSVIKKILMLLFVLSSCQTPNPARQRESASVDSITESQITQPSEHQIEEKTLNSFKAMMTAPNDGERSRRIANYLDRQRNFFYIAQGLVAQFDEKLDQIYDQYSNQDNVDLETAQVNELVEFNNLKLKNLIAWEFSERNLHEMLDVYYLTLKHANDPQSPYQKANEWAVKNIKDWIKSGYNSGDQMATIVLSQAIENVNKNFVAAHKLENLKQSDYTIANLSFYANKSGLELQNAYKQSLQLAKNRPLRLIDAKLEKDWTQFSSRAFNNTLNGRQEFKNNIRDQIKKVNKDSTVRTPQSGVLDELEPSATSKGNVTGNRFPNGKWAFTFDDGPDPVHTQGMFDVLKKHEVHGTFFWQTQNMVKYPKYSEIALKNGFHRASHSYTHVQLTKQNAKGLDKEINQAVNDFAKVVGEKPTLFRCPYGACGPNGSQIRSMIANQNMLHIFWNVDTLDWQDKNAQSIFNRSKKQVDLLKRGIVLFHDVHPQSVLATDLLIGYMKTKYKIEPLNKLIEEARGKAYHSP